MKRKVVIIATVLLLFPLLGFGAIFLANKAHSYGYYSISLWVYKPLAELGIDAFEKKIGSMFVNEQGVPKDYKEAAKWYRNPAENGDTQAQAFLGLMYMTGSLGVRDLKKSFEWFSRAANAGHRNSQSMVAVSYTNGDGVTADKVQAYKWHLIYFDGNVPTAFREKLKKEFGVEFTPEQVAEARILAREWIEKFQKKH